MSCLMFTLILLKITATMLLQTLATYCVFVYNYLKGLASILHYYETMDKVLRSPRGRIVYIALHVPLSLSIWAHLALYPVFYLCPSIDERVQVMLGNLPLSLSMPSSFNLVVFVLGMPVPLIHLLLYPIFTTKNYQALLFVKPKLQRQLSLPARQRDRSFQQFYRIFGLLVAIFITTITLFILAVQRMMFSYSQQHSEYFYGSLPSVLHFVALELNMVHIYIGFIFLARVYFELFFVVFYFSFYTFRELTECERRLRQWHHFQGRRFCARHANIVGRIFQANHIIGKVLVIYFLTNAPTSSYFIMFILLQTNVSIFTKMFIGVFMAQQFIFIFLIHLVAASYSSRIHRFTKPLISLLLKDKPKPKTKLKPNSVGNHLAVIELVRLCNYLDHFNKKNLYGLNYGWSNSLITFKGFFGFLFIYLKFLFYYYHHLQTKNN